MRRSILTAAVVFALPIAAIPAVTVLAQRTAVDLTGTWSFAVVTENGTGTPTVTFTQKGDSLTGTYASSRMGTLPFTGRVKGSALAFDVVTSGGTTLAFKGTIVDADHVKGDADFGGQGTATFTGERRK